jgi:SAM-dependent methyltransferase
MRAGLGSTIRIRGMHGNRVGAVPGKESLRAHRSRHGMQEPMATRDGGPPAQSNPGVVFGSVAGSYERYRLGYPGELRTAVFRYAGRPVCAALEVGAGTGKATRLFAVPGVEITALEPDPAMAALLVRTTEGLPVEPVVATFERFRARRRFDLVYSAAAWHWTRPQIRWAKAVKLLVPGGVLALFGRPGELMDSALRAAVDDIERRLLPDHGQAAGHPWSIEDMTRVDGLSGITQHQLPGVATLTAADFTGRLATVSAYLRLQPDHRAEALRQVRAVLPSQVDIDTTVQLALGRRI